MAPWLSLQGGGAKSDLLPLLVPTPAGPTRSLSSSSFWCYMSNSDQRKKKGKIAEKILNILPLQPLATVAHKSQINTKIPKYSLIPKKTSLFFSSLSFFSSSLRILPHISRTTFLLLPNSKTRLISFLPYEQIAPPSYSRNVTAARLCSDSTCSRLVHTPVPIASLLVKCTSSATRASLLRETVEPRHHHTATAIPAPLNPDPDLTQTGTHPDASTPSTPIGFACSALLPQ